MKKQVLTNLVHEQGHERVVCRVEKGGRVEFVIWSWDGRDLSTTTAGHYYYNFNDLMDAVNELKADGYHVVNVTV